MAEGNSSNYKKIILGAVVTILTSLTIMGIVNSITLVRHFALLEERYEVMTKINLIQSERLVLTEKSIISLDRRFDLLEERQRSLISRVESGEKLVGSMQALNVEQQYQINQLLERVRLSERQRAYADNP